MVSTTIPVFGINGAVPAELEMSSTHPDYVYAPLVSCDGVLKVRNSPTQRTMGPACEGIMKVDVSDIQDGDYAGLSAFQCN